MHRRLLTLTVGLAALALAATAVPALTADSGTVTLSITARAPAAPCLIVTPGSVSFGTLPFSTNAGAGMSTADANITTTNCGTAGQNLLGSTTDATGSSGSWTPFAYTGSVDPCVAPNGFYLSIFGFNTPSLFLTHTPAAVLAALGGASPAVFPPGDKVFRMTLVMPCQGSDGAGETKTLSSTFTAVVA
jgi:hypothetical protein